MLTCDGTNIFIRSMKDRALSPHLITTYKLYNKTLCIDIYLIGGLESKIIIGLVINLCVAQWQVTSSRPIINTLLFSFFNTIVQKGPKNFISIQASNIIEPTGFHERRDRGMKEREGVRPMKKEEKRSVENKLLHPRFQSSYLVRNSLGIRYNYTVCDMHKLAIIISLTLHSNMAI